MSEQSKRKIDIFSLYKKEKLIRIEDNDTGDYVEILLVKMTQGQRLSVVESYNMYLEKERIRLREREEKSHSFALAIERYTIDDYIAGIIAFELAQRTEIADLLPSLDGKTTEERQKILNDEIDKFKKQRIEELKQKTRDELKQYFIDITVESQALLASVRILNFHSILHMCVDPETRQPIFNSIDDIEKIIDARVIDKLVEEVTDFRSLESQKNIRDITANDQSFLQSGVSQKSSTDSPVTTS